MRKRQLAVIGGAAAVCGITAWILIGWRTSPPLIANLPFKTWDEASEVFSKRLAAEFPTGTPERDLITELLKEGFRERAPTTSLRGAIPGYRKSYEFDRSELPCRVTWGVYWKVDSDARVTNIVGQKNGICL